MTKNLDVHAACEPEAVERKNFILDRCWAPQISAAGGVLGVLAAREIVKKNYGKGAVLAGGAAIMDWLDGIEARRFARRNPEAGLARQNKGGWEDQIWDRVRNIAIGAAILTVPEVPGRAKAVVAPMVAKETITGIVGLRTLADHYVQECDGWPTPIPSADRGKEAMWEVGAGLSGIMLGAKIAKTNPEVGQNVSDSASVLCGIGLIRGLQTAPEYKRVIGEMAELTPEELMTYEPNYKPHIIGRLARIHDGLKSSVETYNDNQRLDHAAV